MKKVLMIAYYFPPMGGGGVQRTVKYVKHLSGYGWKPVVITTANTYFWKHDSTLWRDIPKDTPIYRAPLAVPITLIERIRTLLRGGSREHPPETRSSRAHSILKKTASFIFIPDIYSSWIPTAVFKALRIIKKEKISLITSTSPPESAHIVGLILHRITGLPWVADFRDPWVEGISFWTPTEGHRLLHYSFENRVITAANRVVTTTDRTAARFMERHPHLPGDKFSVITNGFDDTDYVSEAVPRESIFTISHTGMLSLKRSNYNFLLGLNDLVKRRPEIRRRIDVRFIGVRDISNDRNIKRLRLDDIVNNLGLLSHGETIEHQLESHLLLLIETDAAFADQIIPGKLFDYIGARRAVLGLLPEGAAAEFIRSSGNGTVVNARDVESISKALEYYYDLFDQGKLQEPVPVKNRSRFSRRYLAGKLARILDECVSE